MGSLIGIGVHDAGIVDPVDTHFAGSMDYLLLIQENADMRDPAFLIIEKCQVAATHFLQKADGLSLNACLPAAIPSSFLKLNMPLRIF